jgi:putative transposase
MRTIDLPSTGMRCVLYDLGIMSNYLRTRTGSTYFFTLVSFHRRPILCHESIRRSLRRAINDVRVNYPFAIDAWVLLPDHLHCIWTLPDGDHDFSTRWSLIKRSVSRFAAELALPEKANHARARRESTIWQRRFWEHLIRDARDFERHLDYIHYNPVKHGHAIRASAWPYSSIHRYVKSGLYSIDWAGGDDTAWGDFE